MQLQSSLLAAPALGAQGRFFAVISDHTAQNCDIDLYGASGAAVRIDWGDGHAGSYALQGSSVGVQALHAYGADGTYTILLTGDVHLVTGIRRGGDSVTDMFAPSLPHGLLAFPMLADYGGVYGQGDLTPVLARLPLGKIEVLYGRAWRSLESPAVHCDVDAVDWSAFTLVSLFYSTGVTGSLSSFAAAAGLEYLTLRSVNVSGSLHDVRANTALVQLALILPGVTGDIADLAALPNLTQLNLVSSGVNAYTPGANILWPAGISVSLTGVVGLSAAAIAALLQDMLNSGTSWDGAELSVSGCNGGTCTAEHINTAHGTAGWIETTVAPAGITVHTD